MKLEEYVQLEYALDPMEVEDLRDAGGEYVVPSPYAAYWCLLDGLSRVEKEVLDFMYFDGETCRNTARILGISENEAMACYVGAKAKMKARMKEKGVKSVKSFRSVP